MGLRYDTQQTLLVETPIINKAIDNFKLGLVVQAKTVGGHSDGQTR
jgi:hypothetical protein